jgi:hypothetical protein
MEHHINLHTKMSKMRKGDNGSNKINVKMTSCTINYGKNKINCVYYSSW